MATEQVESSNPADKAEVSMVLGTQLPLADSEHPVKLATSSDSGDHVDEVFVPPMSGEFVQTTGMDAGSLRRDSLFYITDDGVRYAIPDLATAQMLGLGKVPHLAPWAIVGQLVPGPTLSRTSALESYDSVPPSPAGSDDSPKTTTASN